jgi:hypothetical protein
MHIRGAVLYPVDVQASLRQFDLVLLQVAGFRGPQAVATWLLALWLPRRGLLSLGLAHAGT